MTPCDVALETPEDPLLDCAAMSLVMDHPLGSEARPLWRGRLHVYAVIVAVPTFVLLILRVHDGRSRTAVTVHAIGVCSMLLISATYHRWVHTVRARELWRRADHSAIYAAIAGTATPMCMLVAPAAATGPLLVMLWGGGACGAAMKLSGWRHARVIGGSMYMILGWSMVVLAPALWRHAGAVATCLVMLGGACYTIGAIGLLRRWPLLRPGVFSYHEVWHAWTIAAAGLHVAAVWIIAT